MGLALGSSVVYVVMCPCDMFVWQCERTEKTLVGERNAHSSPSLQILKKCLLEIGLPLTSPW